MTSHRVPGSARRSGARKALPPARSVLDPTPVARDHVQKDDRLRPIPRKRPRSAGATPRTDPTRVSGPIRVVLEPMLWLAFVSGVVWLLVAMDPGVTDPDPGVVVYEYTQPLSILVGALLLISTISALMWLSSSTSATRARSSFAGLGMLASGWLFAKVHPVDNGDFVWRSWTSIGVGVLLVAMCSVPWPTSAARVPRRPTTGTWMVLAVLLAGGVIVCMLAWEASRTGLVGSSDVEQAWDLVLPFLIMLALLLAVARFVLHRPQRTNAG
ncbi:hypothetical protein [Nocardioides houyundeii]|uniref:hypothetical protein n=1 Tax=Nocardioides houyundeii TaxID=2045452 RepID=UPI0013B4267B|nr:hypothetical protein [Nocardioides houyundeii]